MKVARITICLAVALPATLLFNGAPAAARIRAFDGGPFDALRAEFPETDQAPYFIPGLARENSPSPELQAKIDASFAAAKKTFAASKRVASGDTPGLRNRGEQDARFEGRLLTQCRAEDVYQFPVLFGTPVSRPTIVRVSIVCGNRVTQFITFRFGRDVMIGAQVVDAIVPSF